MSPNSLLGGLSARFPGCLSPNEEMIRALMPSEPSLYNAGLGLTASICHWEEKEKRGIYYWVQGRGQWCSCLFRIKQRPEFRCVICMCTHVYSHAHRSGVSSLLTRAPGLNPDHQACAASTFTTEPSCRSYSLCFWWQSAYKLELKCLATAWLRQALLHLSGPGHPHLTHWYDGFSHRESSMHRAL